MFSNCVGNPDCDCNKGTADTTFSNATGNSLLFAGRKYSSLTGEIAPIQTSISLTTPTIPTVTAPAPSTVPTTTTNTQTASTSTLDKITATVGSVAGILGSVFTKPATTTVTGAAPEEKKGIPMGVYVVIGGLLVLVITYVIIKASRK
jgi:hypothetical protein